MTDITRSALRYHGAKFRLALWVMVSARGGLFEAVA
jgi:hypothetical protein